MANDCGNLLLSISINKQLSLYTAHIRHYIALCETFTIAARAQHANMCRVLRQCNELSVIHLFSTLQIAIFALSE